MKEEDVMGWTKQGSMELCSVVWKTVLPDAQRITGFHNGAIIIF